jgi:hypothetical protein
MMVGQIKKNHTMPRATETWTSDVDISPVKNLLTRHVLPQPKANPDLHDAVSSWLFSLSHTTHATFLCISETHH